MANNSCPTRNDLEAFAHAYVSEEQFGEIADHLENCSGCEEILVEVEKEVLAASRLVPAFAALANEPECQEAIDTVRNLVHDETIDSSFQEPSCKLPPALDSLHGFRIIRQLGLGGMGHVYLAEDQLLGRLVAIKLLAPHMQERFESRFQRERTSLARIDHPNVVRAHQAGDSEHGPFLVMEFVNGVDAGSLCRSLGRLGVADACEIVRQAAMGLQAIHEHGLVHRDVKPSNLMIDAEGTVKIVDLGLARANADAASEMTATGDVLGTAEYISPEQIGNGRQVDIRSDIYSLGCTLFRLLTGKPPYDRAAYDLPLKMMRAHEEAAIPDVRDERTDVPLGLAECIQKMLAKLPDQRHDTPADVCAAVAPFARGANLRALAQAVQGTDTLAGGRNISGLGSDLTDTKKTGLAGDLTPVIQTNSFQPLPRRLNKPLLAGIVLLVILLASSFVVLKVRHSDGSVSSYEIPAGSEVVVSPSGEVEVKLADKRDPISSVTSPVIERIIDDGDRGYSEQGSGWQTGSLEGGYNGDYRSNNKGSLSARWSFQNLPPGKYEAFVTWVKRPVAEAKVHTAVFDGEKELQWSYLPMHQDPHDEISHGHSWHRLGTYTIRSGGLSVEMDCRISKGGCAADAVRIVRVQDRSPHPKQAPSKKE